MCYVHSEVCLNGSVHSSTLLFIFLHLGSESPFVSAVSFGSHSSVLFRCPQRAIINIWYEACFMINPYFAWENYEICPIDGKMSRELSCIICVISDLIGSEKLTFSCVKYVFFNIYPYIYARTINSQFQCTVKLLIMLSIQSHCDAHCSYFI